MFRRILVRRGRCVVGGCGCARVMYVPFSPYELAFVSSVAVYVLAIRSKIMRIHTSQFLQFRACIYIGWPPHTGQCRLLRAEQNNFCFCANAQNAYTHSMAIYIRIVDVPGTQQTLRTY